jgi:hypothetical protein
MATEPTSPQGRAAEVRSSSTPEPHSVRFPVKAGYSKKKGKQRKRLLKKPLWLAGIAACEWIPREPSQSWLEAHALVSKAARGDAVLNKERHAA